MTIEEWKDKNKYARGYAHFDNKVSLKNVWNNISRPIYVCKHAFYPFIHYSQEFKKFSGGKIKIKKREICYSAHIDRYIYSYYGYLINEKYNQRVIEDNINEVAIAYRNNLKLNNISFAKKAFDCIKDKQKCYVIIGDFTNFFDNLDHKYLKEMLCDLLNAKRLPDDYYAVYKNITKFSTWQLEDILSYYNLKNKPVDIKNLNKMPVLFTKEKFHELKKKSESNAKKNTNNYGIPQGSAISAVLSNVYMLSVDNKINEYVSQFKGLYMRYSDDIIIVLPDCEQDRFEEQYTYIMNVFKETPNLNLQEDKTQVFYYCDRELHTYNNILGKTDNEQNRLNYLGFTFDGKEVTIRDKTITKYYYRMYRKLKTIVKNNGYTKDGKRISAKNVYMKYSIKGATPKVGGSKGNFITYVRRAQKIFIGEPIDRSTKRHLLKIRRELDKINNNNPI